jgi:hypothetical protein
MNGPSRTPVATAAALSAWAEHDWSRGVRVGQLSPYDRLTVQTENSTYDCVVVSPGRAQLLVRGGAFFPDFTPVRLAGSSLGGGFLKLGTVHVGFCLELIDQGRCIVTSPVRSIVTAPADAGPSAVM